MNRLFFLVGAKDFSPLRMNSFSSLRMNSFSPLCMRMHFFLPLFILLLTAFSGNVSADQVTVPLADPAAQNQSVDQSVDQSDKPPEPVMTEGLLYDIREPVFIPDRNRDILIVAGVLVAVLLIGLLLFFFWKKRTQKQKVVFAHESALHELDQAEKLIEEHNIAAFVTLIDQTLRRYIEQRFGIFARRQTTREFIHGLAEESEEVPKALTENSENLKTWLQHFDLVKFAKAGLSRETMMDMAANLRTFIQATKVEAEKK